MQFNVSNNRLNVSNTNCCNWSHNGQHVLGDARAHEMEDKRVSDCENALTLAAAYVLSVCMNVQ